MPVFEYRCKSCGATYDVYHRSREIIEDVVCPSCSSPEHTKLFSAPSLSLGTSAAGARSEGPSCDEGGGCCGGSCQLD